jgi:tryptophan synthase beta chain
VMVRDFQTVIGREAREQFRKNPGGLPGAVVACINGGSNAIGIFHAFLGDSKVKLIGVEAAGEGLSGIRHAATLSQGRLGVLHGSASMVLQDENGQIQTTHSIAPGLDYPGVGPEHAYLKETGRATYVSATDDEVLDAFQVLTKSEGILPALESAHAVAYAMKLAPSMKKTETILICLSGRGDKDISSVERALKDKMKAALYLIS